MDRAVEKGWESLANGELIRKAEADGCEVVVTTDQRMRYQQNLAGRRLAIVVPLSTAWPKAQRRTQDIRAAIKGIRPGEWREVPV